MHTCEQQKQSGKVELLPEHLYAAAHTEVTVLHLVVMLTLAHL